MHDIISWTFGEGPDLKFWQMSVRAALVFFFALALIRVSGRRSLGQQNPFDACITVLLGAVLSRAVVGASPFWATISAAAALVLMHRAVALASIKWSWFDDLVNGREVELIREGQMDRAAMKKALLTRNNIDEAMRQKLGDEDIANVARAVLERDGAVTIIGRD